MKNQRLEDVAVSKYLSFLDFARGLTQRTNLGEVELNCILTLGQNGFIATDEQVAAYMVDGKLQPYYSDLGVSGMNIRDLTEKMPFSSYRNKNNGNIYISTVSQVTTKLAKEEYLFKGPLLPKKSIKVIGLTLAPKGKDIYQNVSNELAKYFLK